jgi:hypothetical protein
LEKRLLDRNPVTGVEEWFHYDPMTGDVHIETRQDVEPILDLNKMQANDADFTRKGIKNDMWRYASVPVVVQMRWLSEYGSQNWPMKPGNEKLLFRLLNSPEWRYLKTTEKIHVARS